MITYLTRRTLLVATLLPAALLPVAASAQAGPLVTVASFSILADLVRQVGGDAVAVTSLVPPDTDPHTFQPRPGDLRRLRDAAVMVENGLGLEGWLQRMVQTSGFRGTRITATAGITPRGGRSPDPHVWQDPRLGEQLVRRVAAGLGEADPARASAYQQRGDAYIGRLQQVDAEIERRFAAVPADKRRVITTHDAFEYYGARYGITFMAAEGISTEAEPTPRRLAQLAAQMRREGIRIVFLENMSDPRIARAIAREAGAKVGPKVYADSLSPPDGPAPTYLDLLRYNTEQFVTAMTSG